jgi:hypothetical protein
MAIGFRGESAADRGRRFAVSSANPGRGGTHPMHLEHYEIAVVRGIWDPANGSRV